jgi:hypothetical protein
MNWDFCMRNILILAMLVFSVASFAKDNNGETQREIAHLLTYLKNSNCEFNRNGTWYSPDKAVSHLNRKYQYLLKRGLIKSTEQFIDRAASKSSMSGKPYLVKCGESDTVESAIWFTEELLRFRRVKHK